MRLLTHNAYWFQGAPSLWGRERPEPHPEALPALIDLYRRLAPDVLCLQEVHAPAVAETVAAALGLAGRHVPGGQRPAYGGAVLWRGQGAVPCDRSRAPDGALVFERICIELCLPLGERTLTLVAAHLASNRYAPERRGEPVRLAELEALLTAAPEADIVVGDFNARTDSAVHRRMTGAGFDDVCAAAVPSPDVARRRVDYIWVRRDAGLAVSGSRLVTGPDLAHPQRPEVALSDHPILAVDLQLHEV